MPGMPDYPCRLDPESGLYQPLYTVTCWAFYDPATACTVDENGLIEKPDGTKVPYTEAADRGRRICLGRSLPSGSTHRAGRQTARIVHRVPCRRSL